MADQEKSNYAIISAVQSRMARAATGLGVRELAEQAGVSPNTVARLERGEELKPATLEAIRTALEEAGVIFIDENTEGAGVRLRKDHPIDEGDYDYAKR